MKVTFTAYRGAIKDENGQIVGVVGTPIGETGGKQKLTAAGSLGAALPDSTAVIRVSTDTAIHFRVEGSGAADTDPQMFANTVEYFGAIEGVTPSIIVA